MTYYASEHNTLILYQLRYIQPIDRYTYNIKKFQSPSCDIVSLKHIYFDKVSYLTATNFKENMKQM